MVLYQLANVALLNASKDEVDIVLSQTPSSFGTLCEGRSYPEQIRARIPETLRRIGALCRSGRLCRPLIAEVSSRDRRCPRREGGHQNLGRPLGNARDDRQTIERFEDAGITTPERPVGRAPDGSDDR